MKRRKFTEMVCPIVILLIFGGLLLYVLNNFLLETEKNIQANQQKDANRIARILELYETEGTDATLIQKIERIYPASNSSYAILLKGEEIIFLKDAATTAEVRMSFDDCLKQLISQKAVITGCNFLIGNQVYTFYLVSNRSYGIYQMGLDTFYIYLCILLAAMGIFALCYIIKINMSRQRLRRLINSQNQQLRELLLNEEILNGELLLERTKKKENNSLKSSTQAYNLQMVEMLLSKSNDEKLYPFCIMVIRLYLGERYFSKSEIIKIQESIQCRLNENQILCEIAKGEYCLLLYKTDLMQAKRLRLDLLSAWRQDPDFCNYHFKAKAEAVEGNQAKEIFQTVRSDVQNMMKKGSHSYAV